jgi:hypothetical protein
VAFFCSYKFFIKVLEYKYIFLSVFEVVGAFIGCKTTIFKERNRVGGLAQAIRSPA